MRRMRRKGGFSRSTNVSTGSSPRHLDGCRLPGSAEHPLARGRPGPQRLQAYATPLRDDICANANRLAREHGAQWNYLQRKNFRQEDRWRGAAATPGWSMSSKSKSGRASLICAATWKTKLFKNARRRWQFGQKCTPSVVRRTPSFRRPSGANVISWGDRWLTPPVNLGMALPAFATNVTRIVSHYTRATVDVLTPREVEACRPGIHCAETLFPCHPRGLARPSFSFSLFFFLSPARRWRARRMDGSTLG